MQEATGAARARAGERGAAQAQQTPRRRVPGAQRREELIVAAVHEFAHGGLDGTPVERIAHRAGVAQPYVFSLFGTKRVLFLAAIERSFDRVADTFREAAIAYAAGRAGDCDSVLMAMGRAYRGLLQGEPDYLMLQHQCYAACGTDEVVRTRVRGSFARLVALARELSGAGEEELDDFIRYGMALQVAAALGVEDLSAGASWVGEELAREPASTRSR